MNFAPVLLVPVSAVVLAGSAVQQLPAAPAVQASPVVLSRSHPTTLSVDPQPDRGLASGRHLPQAVGAAGGTPSSPAPRGRWTWPLQPPPAVVRPFLPPATRYGAGHRGVDLAGASEQEVLAVEAGTVTHVGSIAGRGTVTVLHSSGTRSTYEPVDPTVRTGSAVARGARLGRLEASGSHCAPAVCLHLGAVSGELYLDPMVLLVGGRRVRLLPLSQVPEG